MSNSDGGEMMDARFQRGSEVAERVLRGDAITVSDAVEGRYFIDSAIQHKRKSEDKKATMTNIAEFTIEVIPEDGQFVSRCIEMGVASCGDTEDEARDNVIEALGCHLEVLRESDMLWGSLIEAGVSMETCESFSCTWRMLGNGLSQHFMQLP